MNSIARTTVTAALLAVFTELAGAQAATTIKLSEMNTGTDYIAISNVGAVPVDISGWYYITYEPDNSAATGGSTVCPCETLRIGQFPGLPLSGTVSIAPGEEIVIADAPSAYVGAYQVFQSNWQNYVAASPAPTAPAWMPAALWSTCGQPQNIPWNIGTGGGACIADDLGNCQDIAFFSPAGVTPSMTAQVATALLQFPSAIWPPTTGAPTSYLVMPAVQDAINRVAADTDTPSDWVITGSGTPGIFNPGIAGPALEVLASPGGPVPYATLQFLCGGGVASMPLIVAYDTFINPPGPFGVELAGTQNLGVLVDGMGVFRSPPDFFATFTLNGSFSMQVGIPAGLTGLTLYFEWIGPAVSPGNFLTSNAPSITFL